MIRRALGSLRPVSASSDGFPEGGWWPRAEQRELLRAALGEREVAAAALPRWRAMVDLDDVDVGSFGLLPLLAARLEELGSRHPDDDRIRGVRRKVWAKNQLHLVAAAAAAAALDDAAIPVVFLKGIPMVTSIYGDSSARLMADIDLLVEPDNRSQAIEVLERLGWHHTNPLPNSALFRAAVFDGPNGTSLDLQWRMLQQPDLAWYDDDVRQRAVTAEVRGHVVARPSNADMLVHTIVHGAKANPVPPLRWVADAAAVIGAGVDDDAWSLVLDIAKRGDLSLPLAQGLSYLQDLLALPIPTELVRELERHRPPSIRRIEHRLAALPAPLRRRSQAVTAYMGEARNENRRPTPIGFVRFANEATGADSIVDLARRTLSREALKEDVDG